MTSLDDLLKASFKEKKKIIMEPTLKATITITT